MRGLRRDVPATWVDDRWPLGAGDSGILPHHGAGHCAAMWRARRLPRVVAAFEALWGTKDLLASFDGPVLFRPWWAVPCAETCAEWWHVDQNPLTRPGQDCVQGCLNLMTNSRNSGGTALLPGSHKFFSRETHERIHGARLGQLRDYVPTPRTDALVLGARAIVPLLEPGDLLLWDSRTTHCSAPATEGAANDALARAACLVCFTPRDKADDAILAARRDAARNGATTTHYPHACVLTKFHEDYASLDDDVKRRYRAPPPPALTDADWAYVG